MWTGFARMATILAIHLPGDARTFMAIIRPFLNSDLPGVFEVWMRHWQAAKQTPPVSVSILERAIMARQFFDPQRLVVGLADGQVIAWAHWFDDTETEPTTLEKPDEPKANHQEANHQEASSQEASSQEADNQEASSQEASNQAGCSQERVATLAAFCLADEPGLAICDQLLADVEEKLKQHGIQKVRVGSVQDDRNGYAGLAPIGHGIGIPVSDARTNSMLSRHGYHVDRSIDRMVVGTSTYRPPVNRSFLQFRRSTRLDHLPVLPIGERTIAAMSHFDIERHILMDHRQQEPLAICGLWMGDPEVQVMESSRAILSLNVLAATDFLGGTIRSDLAVTNQECLTDEQQFLIASMVQSLSNRQIFTVETAVDRSSTALIEQLKQLKFECIEQGRQWTKVLAGK